MTSLKQRLGGAVVLTAVSAVSLLAGGLLLGAASADDGDDPPSSAGSSDAFEYAAEGAGVAGTIIDGEGCVVAFRGEPPEGMPHIFSAKPVDGVAHSKVEAGKFI